MCIRDSSISVLAAIIKMVTAANFAQGNAAPSSSIKAIINGTSEMCIRDRDGKTPWSFTVA